MLQTFKINTQTNKKKENTKNKRKPNQTRWNIRITHATQTLFLFRPKERKQKPENLVQTNQKKKKERKEERKRKISALNSEFFYTYLAV